MRTWVDASTLIALDSIGELDILRELLGRVALTKQVETEVFTRRESQRLRDARGELLEIIEVRGDIRRWLSLGPGKGEASMFLTPPADRLVLDEPPARTVAEAEGRDYVGLLGLLVAGVERNRIPASRAIEILERLLRSGFRLSTDLYDDAMRALRPLEERR